MVHRTDKELEAYRKHGAINLLQMGVLPGALISRGEARSAHIARSLLPEEDIFRFNAPNVRSAGKMWDASDAADLAIEVDSSHYQARRETIRAQRGRALSFEPMIGEAIQWDRAYAAA